MAVSERNIYARAEAPQEEAPQGESPEKGKTKKRAKKKGRGKRVLLIILAVIAALILFFVGKRVYKKTIVPAIQYKKAAAMLAEGQSEAAAEAFENLRGYKDSADRAGEIWYSMAENSAAAGTVTPPRCSSAGRAPIRTPRNAPLRCGAPSACALRWTPAPTLRWR